MKIKCLKLCLFIFLLTPVVIWGQNEKYGKVSQEELKEKVYPADSSANAVILYKKRRSTFEYNQTEGWLLVTKIHQRTKFYTKDGFDYATKSISLFSRGGESELITIKATTYNLEGSKIVKTKLKGKDIFDEKINKYWKNKKFTMPNIKPGSIIEWEYTIRSPYFSRLDDMVFQHQIPVKHLDLKISIPEYFKFKYLPSTYYHIPVNQTEKARKLQYAYRSKNEEFGALTTLKQTVRDITEAVYHVDVKAIPAIKKEPFVNNINNYRSKASFELTAVAWPDQPVTYYNSTWEDVTKSIYKNENFGSQLNKTSYYKDDMATILSNSPAMTDRLSKIFQLVKQKIKWNGNYGKYTADGVRQAYKNRVGNVAEINLTLVNMLRSAGIEANPILISTRDHGIPLFPTTLGFNYVIVGVELQDKIILMDATEVNSMPNELPIRDLNWQGRLIRKDGSSVSVDLLPKSPSAEKIVLSIKFNEDGIEGSSRIIYTKTKALSYRNQFSKVKHEDIIAQMEMLNDGILISDFRVSNEDDLSKPIVVGIKFTSDQHHDEIEDKIYFSPLLHLTKKKNPFTLDERKFPVDFGTPWEENYSVNIDIPEGYAVDSKPEDLAITLSDNMGTYKYISKQNGNKLQIISQAIINAPVLGSNYYLELKEYYAQMVKKQLEKIVLVKL